MKDNVKTVLLVEDEPLDVQNIKQAFARHGMTYRIVEAENGQQALQMLRGEGLPKITPSPRLILLDIRMPVMNGIRFLQELRADSELKACSVFIFTHSDEEQDKINGYGLNVAGYILKPAGFQELVTTIGCLIDYWNLIEMPVYA